MYVKEKWDSYAAACVPTPPGTTQYEETRKAFYAAGVAIMDAVERTGESDMPEAVGLAFLNSISEELRGFVNEIKTGSRKERTEGTPRESRSRCLKTAEGKRGEQGQVEM